VMSAFVLVVIDSSLISLALFIFSPSYLFILILRAHGHVRCVTPIGSRTTQMVADRSPQ
jgi:hypothetical protein